MYIFVSALDFRGFLRSLNTSIMQSLTNKESLIKRSQFTVKRLRGKRNFHLEKYIFVRSEIIFIFFSPKIIFVVRKVNSLCQKIKF